MQTLIGKNLEKAISLLENDDIVAIPTETVYGLAGNALSEAVVQKIYEVKKRPQNVPLMIQVSSLDKIINYVDSIPKQIIQLAKRFSPGPLTYVLPKMNIIPDYVTAGLSTIAVRIPDHPLTLKILERLSFPLAVTSANLYGQKSPISAEDVYSQLNQKIPYIIDGGICKIGSASTIIGYENNNLKIFRQGSVSEADIKEVLNEI